MLTKEEQTEIQDIMERVRIKNTIIQTLYKYGVHSSQAAIMVDLIEQGRIPYIKLNIEENYV